MQQPQKCSGTIVAFAEPHVGARSALSAVDSISAGYSPVRSAAPCNESLSHFTILVIQIFVYPNAFNDHLVWGSLLVLLLTRGPGVFSLDYLIERLVFSRRQSATNRVR